MGFFAKVLTLISGLAPGSTMANDVEVLETRVFVQTEEKILVELKNLSNATIDRINVYSPPENSQPAAFVSMLSPGQEQFVAVAIGPGSTDLVAVEFRKNNITNRRIMQIPKRKGLSGVISMAIFTGTAAILAAVVAQLINFLSQLTRINFERRRMLFGDNNGEYAAFIAKLNNSPMVFDLITHYEQFTRKTYVPGSLRKKIDPLFKTLNDISSDKDKVETVQKKIASIIDEYLEKKVYRI